MPGAAWLEEHAVTAEPTVASPIRTIHIGNLAAASTESGVRGLFASYGVVRSYERPINRLTNVPGGFAYLEMAQVDARRAIAALNGQVLDGHALRVSDSRPRRR